MFQISIQPEEIDKLKLAAFDGKITVIDKPGDEFDRAVAYLRRQKVIGFDTESRPCFTSFQPKGGVALLQLSGPKEAFLFRIKHVGMEKRLCRILSDEKIIKVGAAVHDDVRGLQKYTEFEARGFVDLQKIVWEYGIRDKSVKKMSAIILGVRISKTQQLSNWEAEVLSEAQMLYAATDAWVCREMYKALLKSEKHPLTPEEMIPPAQLAYNEEHKSEKHPLTPEEMIPPAQLAYNEEHKSEKKKEAETKKEKKEEEESKAKKHNRRYWMRKRYYRNKRRNKNKNKDNGKDNTEKR